MHNVIIVHIAITDITLHNFFATKTTERIFPYIRETVHIIALNLSRVCNSLASGRGREHVEELRHTCRVVIFRHRALIIVIVITIGITAVRNYIITSKIVLGFALPHDRRCSSIDN